MCNFFLVTRLAAADMLQYVRYPLPQRNKGGPETGSRRGSSESVVTKVAAHNGVLAVGTERGDLWLLDGVTGSSTAGVHMHMHDKAVRDVSWDPTGCYVASCGEDGCVAVVGRRSGSDAARADDWDAVDEHTYAEPVAAVRLEPKYATRRERAYLAGGVGGELVRHTRGWFNTVKDVVVDEGEGAIGSLSWGTHWVAWSNGRGVKIMHGETGAPVSFVPRPAAADDESPCTLFWEADHSLLLGWGDVVMIIRVSHEIDDGVLDARAEIVMNFVVEAAVCGVCPFDSDHLALLSYPPGESGQRPEFQIMARDDGTITTVEALPVSGYETLDKHVYALASTDEFRTSDRDALSWRRDDFWLVDPQTFAAVEPSPRLKGSPPRFYVSSPRDVVVARVRDADDAIDITLVKAPGKAKDALVIATTHAHRLQRHRVQDVVKMHLDSLLAQGEAKKAAYECRRLLGDTETLWEYWILIFDKRGALADLAPVIPVDKPRLARSVYDMVLDRLLATDPGALLHVLKLWGHPSERDGLYSIEMIAARLDDRARRTGNVAPVIEARAELYALDDRPEQALKCLLSLNPADLSDPQVVFDLVDNKQLYAAVRSRVADLAALSRDKAAEMLVRRVDRFPIELVAHQLEQDDLLLWYLRIAFLEMPEAYSEPQHRDLHAKHVHLYATSTARADDDLDRPYDSELLRFLQWSSFVPLQDALTACEQLASPPLYNEIVYILGRMGQPKRALDILLEHVGSVRRAVDFVEAQGQGEASELWDTLIAHALDHHAFLSGLLEYADIASRLVTKIPHAVEIPGLKNKLIHIFHDRRFHKMAHTMCSTAARTDLLDLLHQFYALQNRGVRINKRPEVDPDGNFVVPFRHAPVAKKAYPNHDGLGATVAALKPSAPFGLFRYRPTAKDDAPGAPRPMRLHPD